MLNVLSLVLEFDLTLVCDRLRAYHELVLQGEHINMYWSDVSSILQRALEFYRGLAERTG